MARSIARRLGLHEDLAEAIALAHDLGHPPFGHAGEQALEGLMTPYGGFDHNDQTLHVLTATERRYASYDGLNMTWETLEGVAKHNGPVTTKPYPYHLARYNAQHDLRLDCFASLEAQVAALADDIAYHNHDIDDGLRSGLLSIEDLMTIPLLHEVFTETQRTYPHVDSQRLRHESISHLITRMIDDLVEHSSKTLANAHITHAEQVRAHHAPLITFSKPMADVMGALRQFLQEKMYRHQDVRAIMEASQQKLRALFHHWWHHPHQLPASWYERSQEQGDDESHKARILCDYLAGMTDRYAEKCYQKQIIRL